jgi:hypothetical protein
MRGVARFCSITLLVCLIAAGCREQDLPEPPPEGLMAPTDTVDDPAVIEGLGTPTPP